MKVREGLGRIVDAESVTYNYKLYKWEMLDQANPHDHISKDRTISLVALFGTLAVIFVILPFSIVDDAFIFFRYAHNLAHKGQLVFNLGERVEGITSLLWTLILAAQTAFFHLSIEKFVLFLSLTLITFTVFRLWQLGPILGSTHLSGAVAGLLLILNHHFIYTTTNGLEATLYCALQVEIIYHYSRNRFKSAFIAAGILFMTRPEGLALGLLLLGLVYLKSKSFGNLGIGILIIGLFVTAVTLFRIIYYGSPIPNSIIAKSISPFPISNTLGLLHYGIFYIIKFALSNLYLVLIVLAAIFYMSKTRPFIQSKSDHTLLFCIGGILFSFIVVIRNGGDWMWGYRLLLQYGPLYAVIAILLTRRFAFRYFIVILLIAWPAVRTTHHIWQKRALLTFSINYRQPGLIYMTEPARKLSAVLGDQDVVSAEAIGYVSYKLINTKFHDPIGLMDKYLAKNGKPSRTFGKCDFVYTFTKIRPSVMIWHTPKSLQKLDREILNKYEAYYKYDKNKNVSALVMIRNDRKDDIEPAFSDWQKINLKTHQFK